MTDPRLSYSDVEDNLRRAHAEITAAEAHGLATGLLLTGDEDIERLLTEVIPGAPQEESPTSECRTMLRQLHRDTASDLVDASLCFSPLLPGDDKSLQSRATALRDWCSGFLYGLGLAAGSDSILSPEVTEAVQDITEIARLDVDTIGNSEEEEQAFSELVEFLRMSALLIREELASRGTTAS